jgi:hypothetical protein
LTWVNAELRALADACMVIQGASMTNELPKPTIPAFSSARTLRDACRQSGRDEGGRRCPACPLKYLCENDERWLIPSLTVSPS